MRSRTRHDPEMQTRSVLLVTALAMLVGCSVVPPAPPPQNTASVPAPAPPPKPALHSAPVAAEWQDRPAAAGQWVYRPDNKGSIALFGPAGVDARFAIRCDMDAKRVYLTHPGQLPAGESGKLVVRASTSMKSFDAGNTGGSPALVGTAVDPRDPQLDAMSFSRGTFLIGIKGMPDLILPVWPEIARVVEDCRP
jgi:hypothetical protein